MLTGTSCILRGSWSGMLASVQLVPSSWPTSAHWFAASLRSLHPTDPRIAHNRSRYRHEGDEMHVGSCISSPSKSTAQPGAAVVAGSPPPGDPRLWRCTHQCVAQKAVCFCATLGKLLPSESI